MGPGDLVIKRLKWQLGADLLGMVVGRSPNTSVLVMWTSEDQPVKFSYHITEALLVVDADALEEVRNRCHLDT